MRETRHLWIGNLAEDTREEGIAQHFKRYGKIDKVRFLPKRSKDSGLCACVAFMDIRSAQKAKAAVNTLGEKELITDYFDPSALAASSTSREGQRHSLLQQRSSASRRYESHRESAGDERHSRDNQSSHGRNYQQTEIAMADSYDSDRSRSRMDGMEKTKSQSRISNTPKQHETLSKKHRSDPASKPTKKKVKKKNEEGKIKSSKVKQKHEKERGRSPTIKHKKSQQTSTLSSPGSRKAGRAIGSSSGGRSSSSGSGSRSTSGSRRSTSASSTGTSNSSKTHTSNAQSNSESSFEVEEGPETRKLVAVCIRKLPVRPTVTSLRDGIFHEFKKYGKVKSVMVRGDGPERHALVLFRTAAEANKAVAHAKCKLLFGAAIEATIYEGEVTGQELEECGGIIDEFHPRASRTLFVGNLDKTVSYSDIQNIFVRFGEIVAIEIKKQHNIPQYAFLQYTDIVSVVRAITKMDGEKLGRNNLKLGFGKTVMSSCLWVDGVTDSFTENYLAICFQRYGPVKHVVIDRNRSQALVFYSQYDYAQTTMAKMRARKLNGSRLKMDYASNELIEIFLKHMQTSGQSIQGLENIRQLLQPPSSPTVAPSVGGASYSRPSLSQDSRTGESRAGYYDDRPQPSYSEDQYATTEGSYRRGLRGRSRERHVYSMDQPAHSRQKRGYDDPYERSDYHRDQSWNQDGHGESRRTSNYDQDYRQRDYDVRRDQREYNRKSPRGSIQNDDAYHYRGARDRPRDDRDIERIPERDRIGDRYFSRPEHLSPSHPRYVTLRNRSLSPHPRDVDRYSVERNSADASFRRQARSGSRSPNAHAESLRRINSIERMESKSSSRSGSRYTSRTGDMDMREYLDEDKISVTSPHCDERIVEYIEKAKKLRIRKRITADSPVRDSATASSPKRHADYRSGSDKDASSQVKQRTAGSYEDNTWDAESTYSDNRSRSGTPTRDENQDLIGEVIIKQPSKSSSRGSEKIKTPRNDAKTAHIGDRKDVSKTRDKDYRKGITGTSDSTKLEKPKPVRSTSSSLIQRVHSPSESERKGNLQYTKDFDYRKHSVVRSSKSSGDVPARHKLSKTHGSRHDDLDRLKHSKSDYDDHMPSSPRSMSSSSEKSRQRGTGSSILLKREYSPRPEEEDKPCPAKTRKISKCSRQDTERQKYTKERDHGSGKSRDGNEMGDVDDRKAYSQKRRHSSDIGDEEDEPGVISKRERKLSSRDYSRNKSSHHHPPQVSQKHGAPISIARQMFLQEEEGESGAESPALAKAAADQTHEDVEEELVISKSEVDEDKQPTVSSSDQSPTSDFSSVALAAAQSLLPKRLPKSAQKASGEQDQTVEKKPKAKKDDGNLTELEKEKERLQQLLSKLDREKQLDVKDAVKVADAVLQELTEKARSKILSAKPVKEPVNKNTVEAAEVVKETKPSAQLEKEDDTEHGYHGDDITFEEEIVVDTIEEVTEDEVIEIEVIAVKEEEEVEVELHPETQIPSVEGTPEVQPEEPIPVVPVRKTEEYDHTQGYRKQMEARKRETEKLEKKREHERKKLMKKQEKEKKKQMKRVQAMRGPSQNVICSVDDGDPEVDDDAANDEATSPSVKSSPPSTADSEQNYKPAEEEVLKMEEMDDPEAKNDEATSLIREVDEFGSITTEKTDLKILEPLQGTQTKNEEKPGPNLGNPDLERPWPPDKRKPVPAVLDKIDTTDSKNSQDIKDAGEIEETVEKNISDEKAKDAATSKSNSALSISLLTPGSVDTPTGLTPQFSGKEPSPKSTGLCVTPTGSLASSVSHKSSLATPATTPSQTVRTPNFMTPSPASTSSTSSSQSQQKQKQMKTASIPQHHRSGQQPHLSKRPSHHSRPEHQSRSRGNHNSDQKRRPSHQQLHRSSSSGHGSKPRLEVTKKTIAPVSRRHMATITVGLDANPSKPMGKNELDRLKIELESVRSQLTLEMSPSSLSPCSGDEGGGGKSPAQLLSPASPVQRSPADSVPLRRVDTASLALQSGVSPSSTPTLTDRFKLLGRVKKRTPGTASVIKTEGNSAAVIQQDKEMVFRQSRIFRSSIFDQDSERLSHVCRQLDDDKDVEGDQKTTPIPTVVPLFSGSKFLEPSEILSNAPVSVGPIVPSIAASPTSMLAASGDGAMTTGQSQLSSISGPKNVLPLSSFELPVTAERKQHDFGGKNCNITTSDTLTNNTKEPLSSDMAKESSNKLTGPPSDNHSPPSGNEQPEVTSDLLKSKEQSSSRLHLETSPNSLVKEASMSETPNVINSRIDQPMEDEGSHPENHNSPLEIKHTEDNLIIESKHDVDDQLVEETSNAEKLQICEATRTVADDYIGEEVVRDMNVYAGSCMEISESPSGVEVTDTVEHVELAEEVKTQDTDAEDTKGRLEKVTESPACTPAKDCESEKDPIQFEISSNLTKTEKKTFNAGVNVTQDLNVEEPVLVSLTDKSESTEIEMASSTEDFKPTSLVSKATDPKEKPKMKDKTAKKTTELTKDIKKSKHIGKHKLHQKEAKADCKESSSKKAGIRKTKSDEVDSQQTVGSKDTKFKSEHEGSAKTKSSHDKGSTKSSLDKNFVQKSGTQSTKQSSITKVASFISSAKRLTGKDSKVADLSETSLAATAKTFSEKSNQLSEAGALEKVKDNRSSSKEKKSHNEGRKDKKSLDDKKLMPLSDLKTEAKKAVKKKEKQADAQGPDTYSLPKANNEKEHAKDGLVLESKALVLESKKDSDKGTLVMEEKGDHSQEMKESLKIESRETGEARFPSKKKKQKKQPTEKDESMPTTFSDKKQTKHPENVTKPTTDETQKGFHDVKKGSEKPKKSSKVTIKKQKLSERKSTDGDSKQGTSKHKKEVTKNPSDKSAKKSALKKVSKSHAGLKPSHSLPGKPHKKEEEISLSKKDKKTKSGKSSSMSPAYKKQSRYSTIYFSDSSSDGSDNSTAAILSEKRSTKPTGDGKPAKEKDLEKGSKASTKTEVSEKTEFSSKSPDLDGGGARAESFQRHRSFSSCSSMSDSAGPPPVVSSSLLVTETIKNETILPAGYEGDGGFTDSSDEEKDDKPLVLNPSEKSKSLEKSVREKKKKKIKHQSIKSEKKKQKTSELSKTSVRRIMWSTSDSDSSDSMSNTDKSGSSEEDTTPSTKSKPDSRFTDEDYKNQETLLGLYLTSSDEEEAPQRLRTVELKAKDEKTKKKPPGTSRIPAKISPKEKKPSKVFKPTSHTTLDSDSSDADESGKEKKKKNPKPEKESAKEKRKGIVEQSSVVRKNEDRPKLGEGPVKKTTKEREKPAYDFSSDTDVPVAEKAEPKDVSKTKDLTASSKKSALSKLPSKAPNQQVSKTILEKTKSDSKVLKPSSKSHERKEKFKSKSHSLGKLPSQSVKSKEGSQREPDSKTTKHTSAQDQPRTSFKDDSREEKDTSAEQQKNSKAPKSDSSTKKEHSHKPKHQRHGSPATLESKSQSKEPPEQSSLKNLKKTSKEVKKSDKRPPISESSKEGKADKRPLISESSKEGKADKRPLISESSKEGKADKRPLISESRKEGNADKRKENSGKTVEASKHAKHAKRKKLKMAPKHETKDDKKVEERTNLEEQTKVTELVTQSGRQSPKLNEKEHWALTQGQFNSDSDDDDFEIVEEASILQSNSPPSKSTKNLDLDNVKAYKRLNKPETTGSEARNKERGNMESTQGRPHEHKTPITSKQALHPGLPSASSKTSEKRGGSSERISATSTTDESNAEQRMSVQSAIATLGRDNDVEKVAKGETNESLQKENVSEMTTEKNLSSKPSVVKKENVEIETTAFTTSHALSPSKKSTTPESQERKKNEHTLKKAVVKEESASDSSHSGYSRSKHNLHYVAKDRRENIDKIKSVSHERDEEAVRSIMYALDESSDADSYFSDVRPEEGLASSSAIGGRTPDTDRSCRRSRDSDMSGGFSKAALVEPKVNEVKTEPSASSCDPVAIVKSEEQSEISEVRTTAEENELAAAVSSIEFGDFDNKQSGYDAFSTTQRSSFSDRQSTSEDRSNMQKEAPLDRETENLSQEEVEKSSEEAALAASALLTESSEEDGSFHGFHPAPNRIATVNAQVDSNREKKAPTDLDTRRTSVGIEMPSIPDDPVSQSEDVQPPLTSTSVGNASVVAQSNSRKRHRPSKARGSSARSSSRETDWSLSDASTSESEAFVHEAGKTPGTKTVKQKKIERSPSSKPPVTSSTNRSDQYDFDADANAHLNLPKPESAAGNLPHLPLTGSLAGGKMPFVCMSSSPQAEVKHPTPSTASADAPFVNVSGSQAPTAPIPATSSEFSTVPLKPSRQQQRRTSRDSDGGSATGGTAKRRPSSSSSMTVTSPTRGSQMSQLTGLNNTSQSFGGMHMHGSALYPSNNAAFLPPQNCSVANAIPVHQNAPDRTGSHMSSISFHVPSSTSHTFTTLSGTHPNQSVSHRNQIPRQPPQGYHPHMPQQVQTMYSSRPAHSTGSSHSVYAQQPALGATNIPSMQSHINVKMHSTGAGTQLVPKSNISLATTTALSFPTSVSAALTSPAQHQRQFVHQEPSVTASKHTEPSRPAQYHVGVPTYPHHPLPHQPTTQQSLQRTPAPQESVATQEASQKSLPRPAFPHPQVLPPTGHPVYMYPIQGQISSQPPFALQSTTRPPSSHISPTVTAAPLPGSQDNPSAGLQRPPINPYMMQQNVPRFIHAAQVQQGHPVTPRSQPAELQPSMPQARTAEKSESQRSQLSTPATNSLQPGPLPQTNYRELDPTQPRLPGAQPLLGPQQVFPHPLYYPPGVHGFPVPYMPQPLVLRPGIIPPGSVVHSAAQYSEMARQAQQQQRMQMPQPRMPTEEPQTQPHVTLPLQTPAHKDQTAFVQSSESSSTIRGPPSSIHAVYGLPQVPSQPRMLIAPHQPHLTAPVTASYAPHRIEHGDRVMRAPNNQAPADMVDQHFQRSLPGDIPFTSFPPPLLPSGIFRLSNHPPPPSTGSALPSAEIQRRAGAQQQSQPPTTTQYPNLNQQTAKPNLNLPPDYAFPPELRYPTSHHMWLQPAANFRPPTVSVLQSQPHSYSRTGVSTHQNVPTLSTEHQIGMHVAQQEPHPTHSATLRPSSEPNDQVMDLFQRYPVIWQGLLALKNDSAAVQTHFICGDRELAQVCLPEPDATISETDKERNLAILRIVQRMRLEPSQLEGIDKRMMTNSDFCLLLALPCGRDKTDVTRQQNALKQGFIDYLTQKQAAGIVNVSHPSKVQYVLHVFPPCDFTTKHLQLHAQDLLSNINDIQHIMIVIAAV